MVGRTPEWLGKKIEAREIKYAALGALFVPTMVLTLAALSIVTKGGLASVYNSGVHGFTETLYAYDSMSNNNGSAFAGFGLTNFSADFGTIAMLLGRFVPLFAGARARRRAWQEEDRARVGRHVPHRRADVRRPARRRDRADRRPDDLPGADARPDRRRADALMRTLFSSVIAVVVLTAVLGFAYPLAMTGFAQVAFKSQAEGSLVSANGKVVGSKLAAQEFTGARYFHERPSAVSYNAAGTSFANLGPRNPDLAKNVSTAAHAILKLEGPYNPGLTIHGVPVDAVTTSASGIDPDISPAYAQLQAARVAAVRKLPLATVRQLIAKNTAGRSWGFFGEPGVNVLELNLALDREAS